MDDTAARAQFETALREQRPAFGAFFLAKFFGLEISYTEETCVVDFDVKDFMFNPQGSLHGGIIALALDISMGHLIHHVTGRPGLTLEMKTQYMRAIGVGRIRCEGRFLRRGRRIGFTESRLADAEGRLCAFATATWQMPEAPPA